MSAPLRYYDNELMLSTPASVSPMMSPSQLTPRMSQTQVPSGRDFTEPEAPTDIEVLHVPSLHRYFGISIFNFL